MKQITFLWRRPDGQIQSTNGESAAHAANQLGAVLGWADHDTVQVMWRGKAHDFKLVPRGSA